MEWRPTGAGRPRRRGWRRDTPDDESMHELAGDDRRAAAYTRVGTAAQSATRTPRSARRRARMSNRRRSPAGWISATVAVPVAAANADQPQASREKQAGRSGRRRLLAGDVDPARNDGERRVAHDAAHPNHRAASRSDGRGGSPRRTSSGQAGSGCRAPSSRRRIATATSSGFLPIRATASSKAIAPESSSNGAGRSQTLPTSPSSVRDRSTAAANAGVPQRAGRSSSRPSTWARASARTRVLAPARCAGGTAAGVWVQSRRSMAADCGSPVSAG